ncbi:nitrate- and nitrite sensing domain-containing protein [Cellulosimicrobium sp. PMB13]|uniref:sensor histidine kinase n=1 Tax=Cellulosimicrobium sp. PMB13 TaxID=3120158 RepID=UPI003F4B843E
MSVRGKILAALAVPVLVLFIAAAVISGQAIASARTASQTSALVDALEKQDVAGTEIAAERSLSALDSYGSEGAEEQMLEQRKKTDRALDSRDRAYEALNLSALDPRVQDAVAQTIADRQELEAIRRGIDRSSHGEQQRITLYTTLINNALDVPASLADTSSQRELAQYLDAYVVLDRLLAQQAIELPVAGNVIAAAQVGQQNETANQRAAILVTTGDTLSQEARRAVRLLPDFDEALPVHGAMYNQLRANVAGSRPASLTAIAAEQWQTLSTEDRALTIPVRDAVRSDTVDKASALAAAATTRAILTIAATLAAVVASILVAGLIARTIVNPLRRLTNAAEDVRDQLPKLVEQVAVPGQGPGIDLTPITVESTDEVGQLATAFNDVNSTTVKVAREQAALRGSIAEMFVNVARRDQVLLNRQLAFLDDLERSEEDPGTLSNLFRLDHLATRMRRNAESLLVLAGIDSGRRVRQPMPASDVIRTASSEIELYDRVRLNLVVDPLMLGHNALNAAHLLAELLENATMFSEPHTPVEVTTGRDEHAVYITVRDHGLGMTAEEVADANRKVATHAASDVVGAQRLGLFVVGRLADRLGARVRFATGSDGNGTEVTVSFPGALFVPDSNVPLPQPTDPLETSTQAAAQQLAATGVVPAVVEAPAPQQAQQLPAAPAVTAATPTAPAVTSATPAVETEAPVAVPVDLAALTDGTTQMGMPRRRSRTVDPAASAPSASFASGPQTGAIVLPPLATPALPDELPSAEDAWTPPAEVAPAGNALPSRARQAAPTVEPVSQEIPVLDVSTRSALFSSFRPVGDRAATDNPVDLPAAPEVTATDIPLAADVVVSEPVAESAWAPEPAAPQEAWAPQEPAAQQEAWAPQEPAAQPDAWAPQEPAAQQDAWAPQPAEEAWAPQQAWSDEAVASPATAAADASDATRVVPAVPAERWSDPVDDATVVRAPLAQRVPASEPAHVADRGSDVPVVHAEPEAEPEVLAELSFEALPRFEELMADLPTRRSLRESQARKRGLFGRRPRTTATPRATVDPGGPSAEALASRPAGSAPAGPAPSAPLTLMPAEPVGSVTAPPPARASAFVAQEAPTAPASEAAPSSFAAPAPARAPESEQAPAVARASVFAQPERATPPVVETIAPVPATVSDAYAPVDPGRPAAAAAPGTGFGAPTPLVRRQAPEAIEPLEPGYVSDSVEARSDWMASAVLYEEMSTLLRGSTDFQESTLADPNDGTYQPLTVESAPPAGLTRRARGEHREGYVDRFTARIDRDPEQLRARLSAFQSATARGRVEGQEEPGSTWTPETMDYVPDSAPQAR